MAAELASVPSVGKAVVETTTSMQRLALFVLLLICALTVVVLGSPYFEVFPTNRNLAYQGSLSVLFLLAALGLKRDSRLAQYWQMAFVFFLASFVVVVTLLIGGWSPAIMAWLNVPANTSQWIALSKVYEVLLIVVPLLVLTKLSGADLGAIYLRRGNLKWGLAIGMLVLFNFGASAFLFFATRYTSMDLLGAAVAWGLVFSFANGFMEELWLRGIFLRRLQPFLGMGGSILLTSIVFALVHGGATYLTPVAIPFIVANTFTLGLACGYLIVKTDSIWGATLIHAASDFFLFIAMLANA